MEKDILLHIGGMTCVNCQNKIEKTLRAAEGILRAEVSYNDATAHIVYDTEKIGLSEIIALIEKLDYTVLTGTKKQGQDITRTVCLLLIILSLFLILQSTGILNLLAPSRLADATMGYGMLFVIGLITSVHCIAMCGGINLTQCLLQPGQAAIGRNLHPALLYNLGRVVSYTAIGFVLGLLGFLIGGGTGNGVSVLLQGMLKMLAGVFMIVMGLNMLGLFPALRKLALRIPRSAAAKIGVKKAGSRRPFYVGILNGFMPCGPLQSMWIVALASGSPFAGALSMLLFSLGTVPLMLGLGSLVALLGKKFTDKVMTVGAVLVVVLGISMLSQGGSLSGCLPPDTLLILLVVLSVIGVLFSLPTDRRAVKFLMGLLSAVLLAAAFFFINHQDVFSGAGAESGTDTEIQNGVQVVYSTLEAGKYPSITVQAGLPVRWVINAPEGSINGCNYKMIIRDLDLEYSFDSGENVIEFTPEDTGTIRYSCWMGMIHGNIFVTDGTEEGALALGDVTEPTPSGYTIPTEQLAVAFFTRDNQGNQLQEVSIELTEQGFSPAVIVVQKGMEVLWTINVSLDGADLLAPYYATILTLDQGENPLYLYPTADFDVAAGDYSAFAYVKVVDDLNNIDEEAIRAEISEYEPLIYPAGTYAGAAMSCCS